VTLPVEKRRAEGAEKMGERTMEQLEREGRNPWKLATFVIVSALAGAIASGIVVASVRDAEPEPETVAVVTDQQRHEDCSRYAVATHTNAKRVVKTGLFGTAVGAGLGAAGGAIVDGGHGAGKGAGIGALIGATGGTVYGLNEESKKKDAARRAYQACLARNRG
jgi:hypothetical protein